MATTRIGGLMYGDGEYAVEFHDVGSFLAPMRADVLAPDGGIHEVSFGLGESKPSVELADSAIRTVRAAVAGGLVRVVPVEAREIEATGEALLNLQAALARVARVYASLTERYGSIGAVEELGEAQAEVEQAMRFLTGEEVPS